MKGLNFTQLISKWFCLHFVLSSLSIFFFFHLFSPKVQPENVFEPLIKSYSDGLDTSSLKLRIFLQPDHFKNGLLKVKCVSSVLEGYQVSHETNVDVYERDMRVGDNEGDHNPDDATRQRQQQQIPQQNDNKSGQPNRRKKKNRNKQDKKTPVGGIHENMSQGESFSSNTASIFSQFNIRRGCLNSLSRRESFHFEYETEIKKTC